MLLVLKMTMDFRTSVPFAGPLIAMVPTTLNNCVSTRIEHWLCDYFAPLLGSVISATHDSLRSQEMSKVRKLHYAVTAVLVVLTLVLMIVSFVAAHFVVPGESMNAAVKWSLPWMVFLAMGVLIATFGGKRIPQLPYRYYFCCRFVGGVAMFLLAAFTLFSTLNLVVAPPSEVSRLNSTTLPLGVFWVLFPPMWFFAEYYVFDRNLVRPPVGVTKAGHLSSMRDYVGFSSKVWAAVLALFLFSISQIDNTNEAQGHDSNNTANANDNPPGEQTRVREQE